MEANSEGGSAVPGSASEDGSADRVRRLEEIVADLGGNRKAARRSGVPLSTLNGYLAGGGMKLVSAAALTRAAGVRLEWLATGEGPKQLPHGGDVEGSGELAGDEPGQLEAHNHLVTMRSSGVAPPGYVLLPRVEARASAGLGPGVDSDRVVDFLAFSDEWVRNTLHRQPKNLALLEATGDSMDPTIRDGDVLLVDTSVRDIQSSRIYVLQVNGALLVKRIQVRLDGSLVVKSDNPVYEPEVIRPDERSPLRILGQVVWQAGPVRS